tara:strand:- start:1053 stop:1367 length:315 start_codon:yes stop_codon:yes gene_type:complete
MNLDKNIKHVKELRKEGLDKFYTNEDYSKKCITKVFELYDKSKLDLIIEPSAGNGSFYNQIEFYDKVGIDISPENENIKKWISYHMDHLIIEFNQRDQMVQILH